MISVADYADLKYAAVYTVSCVAFYLLTAFCAKLLKKAISGKSKSGWLSLLNCALLSVLLIAAHFFMLGTPWENISAADSVRQYAEEKYTNQKFTSYRAGYDVRSGLYNVNVYYDFKGTTISSPIAVRENSFDDGYFLDTAFSVSSYRSSELISFLKTKFVDDQFTVTCAPFLKSSRDYQYFTALPDDSENKLYLSDMAFNLTFDFELPTASEFYDACRKYYDYLKENNYEFGQITFFGGDKGTMYYYIVATPEAFPDDSSAVIPFTADAYKVFDRAR
ncbi:hypothetical protein SDC9_124664 [bioreactor metagenome]|uniref:Uncharacterized protein n=1 Tax=bioreactor metagenome TaxID=1076179 RepID=A0A645CL17_9ZZZZ